MDKLTYKLPVEVNGRMEADLIKSYREADISKPVHGLEFIGRKMILKTPAIYEPSEWTGVK